jgi:ribosomal protein S27E
MNGHWYCSFCNDIKFLSAPAGGEEKTACKCPDCHNRSVVWVSHERILREGLTVEQAREEFQKIREAIQ